MYGQQATGNNPWNNAGTASSRFPDLNGGQPSPPPGQAQWNQQPQQSMSAGFQQVQGYPQQQQPQQMQINTGFQTGGGYPSPGYQQPQQTGISGFQPTSSFGQQMQWQNGYNQQQPQQQMQTPTNQLPSHLAQFDPYASIGSGWEGQRHQQQHTQSALQFSGAPPMSPMSPGPGPAGQAPSVSASGHQHPRDYIRAHKGELEVWDQYAWKQLLVCFDTLKEAWASRKVEVEGSVKEIMTQVPFASQQGGYYLQQVQQEGARLQGLYKDANSNFDSVAASSFQMHEVFAGYRQSGDLASKRRVREASNAALSGLPDYPPLVY